MSFLNNIDFKIYNTPNYAFTLPKDKRFTDTTNFKLIFALFNHRFLLLNKSNITIKKNGIQCS